MPKAHATRSTHLTHTTQSKGLTIRSLISGPLILAPTDNPVRIAPRGGVTATTTDAIYGGAGVSWSIFNWGLIASVSAWGVNLLGANSTVENHRTISGNGGVALAAGGSVTNYGSGVISATGVSLSALQSESGIYIAGAAGSVANRGTITAVTGYGVGFSLGGSVWNSARITGGEDGVLISGGYGFVTNMGAITGTIDDGVSLFSGGSVVNKAGASITGQGAATGAGVWILGGAGMVDNDGTITGGATGVALYAGGTITNQSQGTIAGQQFGVDVTQGGTLNNWGGITSNLSNGAGAEFDLGGSVTNHSGAALSGAYGIFVTGASGEIVNTGAITGTIYSGLYLGAGGSVANNSGGSIVGQNNGVYSANVAVTVTNSGSISANGTGLDLEAGASVANGAGGQISGGSYGVFVTNGAASVTNAGTITGGSYSVYFATNSSANLLVDDPGAVFNGVAWGGGGTLELASGAGSLDSLGSGGAFQGFQSLQVDSGAAWTLLNAGNAIGQVTNNGALAIAGSLDVTSAIDASSVGTFTLDAGASLEVAQATGSQSQIAFNGSQLIIDNYAQFGTNLLEDFGSGSSVDLANFSSAGASLAFDSSTGLLQISNSASQTATLAFQTSTLGAGSFNVAADGSGAGLLLTIS